MGLNGLMPRPHAGRRAECASPEETDSWYERLWRINQGFDAGVLNLSLLPNHRWVQAEQVRRFEEPAAEPRASTNSYLLEAIPAQQLMKRGGCSATRWRENTKKKIPARSAR